MPAKKKTKTRRTARGKLSQARIMLLFTPELCRGNPWDTLDAVLLAGVDILQVRAKEATSKDFLHLVREIKKRNARRALLLVNDRPDIAALTGADGVHLGQEDVPIPAARKILGSGKLIGVSTHDTGQVQRALHEGADYLGFGPVFPTKTKGYDRGLGPDACVATANGTKIPVFLIGGITPENLAPLSGAKRIAVSSSVLNSADPRKTLEEFRRILGRNPLS